MLLKQWGLLLEGFWARFVQSFRKSKQKQGMIGLEVGNFLARLASPVFSGKVSWLKLTWRTVFGVCSVPLTVRHLG